MSPSLPDPAASVAVVETSTGLEIRLREMRHPPAACKQAMLGATLLSAAGLAVALALQADWPREWTRFGVGALGGVAVGLGLLVPLLLLVHRWHWVLAVDRACVTLHCHESWDQHYSRAVPLASIRSIHAKPVLTIVDPHGEPWTPLPHHTEAEQQHVYRLIVGYLLRTGPLPSLHEVDEREARVETLEKPPESKLNAEVDAHRFRVEFPRLKELPSERSSRALQRSGRIAVGAAVVAFVSILAAVLTEQPIAVLLAGLGIVVAIIACLSVFSRLLGQKRATEATRALTQAISVVGDLLVRTTGLGDKQVWRRGEIRDIGVVVALGTSDSEGNASPDTASLSVLTWKGQSTVLRCEIFDRGRNETPREEIEWIASQLRLALKRHAPPSAEPAPADTQESPTSSSAVVANQRDVQA